MNQELLKYIQEALKQGYTETDIKKALLEAGWQAGDIDEAFGAINQTSAPSTQQPPSVSTSAPITSSLPGALALLGETWSIYKQKFLQLVGIIAIPALILIILPIGIALTSGASIIAFSQSISTIGGAFLILLFIWVILVALSQLWGQTALLYAIKDKEENIGIIEAYRRGWHKIFAYAWVAFLAGIITLGGSLLLIIPGIIFGVWFSLSLYVLIAEDISGMKALLKSKEYIKGYWWGILWRQLFIGFFYIILSIVINLPFNLLPETVGILLNFLTASVVLLPLIVIYNFSLYSNLKKLKGE